MNKHALFHKSQSEWAFPLTRDLTVLRLRTAKDDVKSAAVRLGYKYNEKPIGAFPMEKRFTDTLFDYYECAVPTDMGRRVYHFELIGADGQELLFTETGAHSKEEIPEAYFPHFQVPFMSDSDVLAVPDKFKNAVIYQIFPDRFYTKNPKCDWKKAPKYNDFFGGELFGVADKLDYLEGLGINTLYLTPINPSHTNHHYDVEDYYHVAPELGGDDALHALIDKAHSKGMKIILDGVFNHCSVLNPMFYETLEKGRDSKYFDWFIVDGDKPDFKKCNYQSFAFNVPYMPKLNGDNPEVRAFVSDVAVYWIKQFGIDAWRLDVADDVPPALWREVRQAIKAADRDAIMIGEDWMDPGAFLRGDVFDGVMNYGFTRAMRDYLAYKKTDADGAAEQLVRTYLRTSEPAAKLMMNLIGSHDTHRFFSLCGERTLEHKAALAVMFFFDGMPTVYYGDEIPMNGLHDPDCRRGFDWSRTGTSTAALVTKLANMRKAERGAKMSIAAEDGALMLKRTDGNTANALYVNMTDRPAKTSDGAVEKWTIKTVIDGKEEEYRE